jgi:hypothetical protein
MRFKSAFLGVLFASSVCLEYGCTVADDSADDTTPNAGKGNASHGGSSGGSSRAGASNEGGAAGATNDDAGAGGMGDEPSTGGKSGSSGVSGGTGGSTTSHAGNGGSSSAGTSHGGSGGAGTSGMGGTKPSGGTTSGGGATQSSACQTCATTNCNSATTNGCGHLTGADITKCQTVLDCIVSQKCATNTAGDATSACYCGSESKDSCFFEPSASTLMGACTQVIETATGNVLPLQVATIYYDNSTPVGAATQHIECEQQKCETECF